MSLFSDVLNRFSSDRKNFNHFDDYLRREVGAAAYKKITTEEQRVEAFLKYPPLLKVLALQATMFSLGKFFVYKNGKEVPNHKLLRLLNRPSDRQTASQMLFDLMLRKCLGNAWLYIHSKSYNDTKAAFMKVLKTEKIEFPDELKDLGNKIVPDESYEKTMASAKVKYYWSRNDDFEVLRFNRMIHFPDLSSSIGNWLESPSRVDTLYKQLGNSDESTDSKNINLRFSGKYMVAGKNDINDVNKLPMSNEEKLDIEHKAKERNSVTAVRSLIEVKRYVEDIYKLRLDDAFMYDYFVIGSVFGIPKDVLEAFNSGTYENQHLASGRHIETSMMPFGDLLSSQLTSFFALPSTESVHLSWEHLSFMQRFRKEQAEANKQIAETFKTLRDSGVKIEDINEFLDTNFTEDEKRTNEGSGEDDGAGAQGNGSEEGA